MFFQCSSLIRKLAKPSYCKGPRMKTIFSHWRMYLKCFFLLLGSVYVSSYKVNLLIDLAAERSLSYLFNRCLVFVLFGVQNTSYNWYSWFWCGNILPRSFIDLGVKRKCSKFLNSCYIAFDFKQMQQFFCLFINIKVFLVCLSNLYIYIYVCIFADPDTLAIVGSVSVTTIFQ